LKGSKSLRQLDIVGSAGGDAVGMVLGSLILRSNRSIKSLKVDANFFSSNSWAAIRGAFYGNKKVVDFPFPEADAAARIKVYQSSIQELEESVLNCRATIKRAFKSTKGSRTPYVQRTLDEEVKKITSCKQQIAKMRSSIDKYAKLQHEIQAAIARNQQDEKNMAQAEAAKAQASMQNWRAAEKALEKASALQRQREEMMAAALTGIEAERHAVLSAWKARAEQLWRAGKDVLWFEQWKMRASSAKEGAEVAGPPVLSHRSAELLLSMVPEALQSNCKNETKHTQELIKNEQTALAEQQALESKASEHKTQATKLISAPGMQKPPPGQFAKLDGLGQPSSVVQPPVGLVVAGPVQGVPVGTMITPGTQASRYDQFRAFQVRQTQARRDFASQPQHQQRIDSGAGGDLAFAGAYMYASGQWGRCWECGCTYGHHSWCSRNYAYYDGYSSGHYGSYYYYHDDHYYGDVSGINEGDLVLSEEMGMAELPPGTGDPEPSPTDGQEATDAVNMYAGGEDDRPGGGPPSASRSRVRLQEPDLRPTPPRLDLVEWFEHRIRGAEQSARDAVLGRTGRLPCEREVLLQSKRESSKGTGICLVTHCSLDRLPQLQAQMEAWDDELSVAVFIDAHPNSLEASKGRLRIIEACSAAAAVRALCNPNSVAPAWTVTAVYQLDDAEVRCPDYDRLYPVNTLRNVALSAAHADLVFLLDVDFVPSRTLLSRLCEDASNKKVFEALQGGCGDGSPVALVIPAFELPQGATVPREYKALKDSWDAGDAEGFHLGSFPKGHRATDFGRWFSGQNANVKSSVASGRLIRSAHGVDAYPVAYEEHFEPYVVAPRALVPYYDERFRGYGLNKISHLRHLATLGFNFCVIDDHGAFVAACAHPRSPSWKIMYGPDAGMEHRARLSTHFASFTAELKAAHGACPAEGTFSPLAALPLNGHDRGPQSLPSKLSPGIEMVMQAATAELLAKHLELHCTALARVALAA